MPALVTVHGAVPAALAHRILDLLLTEIPDAQLVAQGRSWQICTPSTPRVRDGWWRADRSPPTLPCPVTDCDFPARSDVGLGVHLSKVHGIAGTHAEPRNERARLIALAVAGEKDTVETMAPIAARMIWLDGDMQPVGESRPVTVTDVRWERHSFDAEQVRQRAAEGA